MLTAEHSSHRPTLPGPDGAHRTDWVGFLSLTVFTLLLYVLTQCDALSPAHDSVLYLRMIETGRYFHPHHLLYNGAAALWLGFWKGMLPGADSVMLISWMNGVFGALSIGVVFLLLRHRAMLDRVRAMLGALLPAASFGVWFYSVTIEVYIPALMFLLAAFYLLTDTRKTARVFIAAGAMHGCAMLFHQVHILFAVPALFVLLRGIMSAKENDERLRVTKAGLGYVIAATLVTAAPYLVIGAGILGHSTPSEFMAWLLGYASEGKYWHAPGVTTVVHVAIGFVRSIVGGDFFFAIDALLDLIQRALPTKWMADQRFAVRNMPPVMAWTLALAFVVFAGIMLFQLVRMLRRGKRSVPAATSPMAVTAVFFVTYSLFFAFWEPSNVEFWIPQSVLFWFAFVTLLYAKDKGVSQRHTNGIVAALLGLLFVINGAGSIFWLMPKENDYYALHAGALADAAGEKGVIVVYDAYMTQLFLGPAYGQRMVIISDSLREYGNDADRAFDAVGERLLRERRAGIPIVIHGECVEPFVPGKPQPSPEHLRVAERMTALFSGDWTAHPFAAGVVYSVRSSETSEEWVKSKEWVKGEE
jgi:hypothetical protein